MTEVVNKDAVNFETFLLSMGTAALIALGEVENPVTKKREKDLDSAKQHIAILEILEQKTAGNLSEREQALLKEILYTARMKFVQPA
jgi:hypothetical protein